MVEREACGKRAAVIVVDIQGDFTEFRKGSLAVPNTGEDYVKGVEAATRLLKEAGFPVFGTQDWHPADHVSFHASHPDKKPGDIVPIGERTQLLWPPHCVQSTENAEVLLDPNLFLGIVKKASHRDSESYSGFHDEGRETELDNMLQEINVQRLIIFGLATDYCVKYTALDGLKKGYEVIVIENLSRGITHEGNDRALREIEREGAIIMKELDIEKIEKLWACDASPRKR